MIQYKASPISRKDICVFARLIRKLCDCEYDDFFDISSFLDKKLPQIMPDFALEIIKKEDMPKEYGITIPSERKMIIREDIYYKAIEGDGFARITESHETFHLFKHSEKNLELFRSATKVKTYENPEWQANAFAGELLAPTYLIAGKTIEQIQIDHKVSKTAAIVQSDVAKRIKYS